MREYTTITLHRALLERLENLKNELGLQSFNEVIEFLLNHWRRMKALELISDLEKVRAEGCLEEIRKVVEQMRRMK
ncbi:MAG: hypothetical protein ACTSXJ_00810 [Candidatus Baldrarchaeia archaeon]